MALEAERHTIADLIDRYIANECPRKKNGKKQERQLKVWWSLVGVYLLKDATPARIDEARDTPANERDDDELVRGPATVNRYLAALSHAFTIAVKE